MALRLSEDITKGFSLLADAVQIPDAAFEALLNVSFDVLLKLKDETSIAAFPALSKVDSVALKQAYSALVGLILEGGKLNSDPLTLKGVLEEHGLPAPRIEQFTKVYDERRAALRGIMIATDFTFPHIVGIDWRLDYYIKSNSIEKVNKPVYFITLKTEEPEGKTGTIEFSCSLEQLQDLVNKLRDATMTFGRFEKLVSKA